MKLKITLCYLFTLLLGINIAYCQTSFLTTEGIAVFYPPKFDSVKTLPSLAIEKDLLPKKDIPSLENSSGVYG